MSDMYVGVGVTEGERADERTIIESEDLTTHGVIVGMTGSGKTGLGVIAIEEALLGGIPALVIDPKGDMANLCLRFPDFAASDFAPWVDEGEATKGGQSIEELAAATAAMWQEGLRGSGVTDEQVRTYADVPMTVYTPGATTGVGLNLVGSLDAPEGVDATAAQDEISDTVSGLLALVGIESDPLTGREHILLTNLITDAWTKGRSLDMPQLIQEVQTPPIRKLGVMDLETFFPADDRMGLALRLNGMLASPTFAAWAQGQPLDISSMLFTPEGGPRCAIVSLAHLSDEERQFVVTLLLSRVITWMRQQAGTSSLRAMIYMDEVFGFVPPVKAPPSKQPILTILKQARAFGVGMVLSTQNPVDIDYKAISNAGTWMIGRLQTEQDKDRLLEGMRASSGAVDIDAISDQISGLDKRQFVLHSTRGSAPSVFATRWAISYLSGPMTGPQIAELMADQKAAVAEEEGSPAKRVPAADAAGATSAVAAAAGAETAQAIPAAPPVAEQALGDDESTVVPTVPDEVIQRFLDPAAGWASSVGAVAGGTRLVPYVAVRVRMTFDETKADLDHTEEFEAVLPVTTEPTDTSGMEAVDYDDRDLRPSGPANAVYVIPGAKINTKTWWNTVERTVRDELYRTRTMTVLTNAELKLWSRPGEDREAFEARCDAESEKREDEEAEKLRAKMETKADRLRDAIDRAQDKVTQLEADVSSRTSSELINIGTSILGSFLGGRKSARGVAADVRRAARGRGQTSRTKQRLETAEGEVVEKMDDLRELEDELAAELLDIDHRWMEAADAITEVEVGLEKTDVQVTNVTLVWVPTKR
ncbi:ATP-binding protein [Euzebya tangerina]|uniref:ATP-binding protein n=1 Tax=Euzebya tangerina TaxID=591198 RepID=UPI000E30C977|nr:ATP-binding protein [Euzebya tangerina]